MEQTFLFKHSLDGITITIMSKSLEGAEAILEKIVKKSKDWENYR